MSFKLFNGIFLPETKLKLSEIIPEDLFQQSFIIHFSMCDESQMHNREASIYTAPDVKGI